MATKTMHLSWHFVPYTSRGVIFPHPRPPAPFLLPTSTRRGTYHVGKHGAGRGTIGSTHVCPLHCVPWWRVVYNISNRCARTAGGSMASPSVATRWHFGDVSRTKLKNTCPHAPVLWTGRATFILKARCGTSIMGEAGKAYRGTASSPVDGTNLLFLFDLIGVICLFRIATGDSVRSASSSPLLSCSLVGAGSSVGCWSRDRAAAGFSPWALPLPLPFPLPFALPGGSGAVRP